VSSRLIALLALSLIAVPAGTARGQWQAPTPAEQSLRAFGKARICVLQQGLRLLDVQVTGRNLAVSNGVKEGFRPVWTLQQKTQHLSAQCRSEAAPAIHESGGDQVRLPHSGIVNSQIQGDGMEILTIGAPSTTDIHHQIALYLRRCGAQRAPQQFFLDEERIQKQQPQITIPFERFQSVSEGETTLF
jgi:hypothetical protein